MNAHMKINRFGRKVQKRNKDSILRLRNRLFQADPHCYCCHINLIRDRTVFDQSKKTPDNWATIEHLTDRARGGTDQPENLTLACQRCNTSHYNRIIEKISQMITHENIF